MAQEESRHTSKNVKWTFEKKVRAGDPFLNDSFFLGYRKDPNDKKKLIIVPEEAETIKLIYNWYVSGVGPNEICRRLEEGGHKTGKGKTKWYLTTVQSILTNEKYCGDLLLQKSYTVDYLTHKRVDNKGKVQQYYVKDAHEAIIDRATWEKAQAIYQRNRSRYSGENEGLTKYTYRYPLSGKLICVKCGNTYKRRHWIQGYPEPRIVYQCNGYINGRPRERCYSHGISEEILLKAVCDLINNMFIIDNDEVFDTILDALKKEASSGLCR